MNTLNEHGNVWYGTKRIRDHLRWCKGKHTFTPTDELLCRPVTSKRSFLLLTVYSTRIDRRAVTRWVELGMLGYGWRWTLTSWGWGETKHGSVRKIH